MPKGEAPKRSTCHASWWTEGAPEAGEGAGVQQGDQVEQVALDLGQLAGVGGPQQVQDTAGPLPIHAPGLQVVRPHYVAARGQVDAHVGGVHVRRLAWQGVITPSKSVRFARLRAPCIHALVAGMLSGIFALGAGMLSGHQPVVFLVFNTNTNTALYQITIRSPSYRSYG